MITAAQVESLPYVELLALLHESNRPPGGMDTVRRLITCTHLRPGLRVLHAGCNAGFLSRELARRSGAHVVGIDLSEAMVTAARARAAEEELSDLVSYQQADMRALPFDDNTFDVVLSGGALAFVAADHRRAISEWARVVRPHGLLADAELFYASAPPVELLAELSAIIGVKVPVYDLQYWLDLFHRPGLEPYDLHVSPPGLARGQAAVDAYVASMVNHLADRVEDAARGPLLDRLRDTFSLFDSNMAYLSYTVMVYTCRPNGFEPSLYA
jgi:SAM-dependent methyltransferase